MKDILADIQSGAYAEAWIEETAQGRPNFNARREEERGLQLEEVGRNLRKMMPWLDPIEVD
jgi:ketol-acid reductoisomerase